jgi:hypothetical protein
VQRHGGREQDHAGDVEDRPHVQQEQTTCRGEGALQDAGRPANPAGQAGTECQDAEEAVTTDVTMSANGACSRSPSR